MKPISAKLRGFLKTGNVHPLMENVLESWKNQSDGLIVLPPDTTFTPFEPVPTDTRKSCTQEEHDACGCTKREIRQR